MQWYYSPDLNEAEVLLTADEAHHLVHVVRLAVGDEFMLTDGKGSLATARLIKANVKDCRAEILKKELHSLPSGGLHLAIGPTKNIDRIEWLLEKSTEMGVQQISLLRSRYSERKEVNMERLMKVIVSASKQSRRTWFPVLNPLIAFDQFVKEIALPAFIAHCNNSFVRSTWQEYLMVKQDCTVMIGPEGDFSEEEIKLAQEAGINGLNLGHRRLRTETAGLAVCLPLLLQEKTNSES